MKKMFLPGWLLPVLLISFLSGCTSPQETAEEDVDMSGVPFYGEKDPVLSEERLRSALRAKNPTWNGVCMTRESPLGSVLVISNGRGLADFSPLDEFRIGVLAVGNFQPNSLEGLKNLRLRELDLFGARRLRDISRVKKMPLKEMYLSANNLTDLSPLAGLPLRKLILECPGATDLSCLRKITSLEVLSVSGHFEDATFVKGLKNLVALQLRSDRLTELDGVSGAAALKTLSLECPKLREYGAVEKLPRLQFLSIRRGKAPAPGTFTRLIPCSKDGRTWAAKVREPGLIIEQEAVRTPPVKRPPKRSTAAPQKKKERAPRSSRKTMGTKPMTQPAMMQ
ncbi:MAG: leucine-rich repeat domain-containing protein [Lentisphaeria bacterium]|nr:leucine-rich repeat domain-containing protein [Lentisphaeria bacterium]